MDQDPGEFETRSPGLQLIKELTKEIRGILEINSAA
jgi:hypothetical protein